MEIIENIKIKNIQESGLAPHEIRVGILEANSVSANGRFYPRSVVESVITQIPGAPMLLDHSEDISVKEIVARGVRGSMQGDLLTGIFKFSKNVELSEQIFQAFKSGLITDVSIRANGETESFDLPNGRRVQKVKSLELFSLDAVVVGGVGEAKLLQLQESFKKGVIMERIKEGEFKDLNEVLESAVVSKEDKVSILKELMR